MDSIIIIQKVYKIPGIGTVLAGEVKSGVLQIGMQARLNGNVATIQTIEMRHESLEEAHVGDNVGLSVSGVSKKDIPIGVQIIFSDGDGEVSSSTLTVSSASSERTKPEPTGPKGLFKGWFGR